jgi:HAD superfamily phosphoserine phosphatase-like hydrolase
MAGAKNEVKVAVFDLNGTLYNEKSKDEFYKFILKKKPKKIGAIFEMGYYQVLGKLHKISQTEFKENFFNYLDDIPPQQVTAYAAEYWQQEYPKQFNQEIMARLAGLKKQGVELFCATGGLELYVEPLFKLYPVDGFAGTRMRYDGHTYLVEGDACKADEKLRRIAQHYGSRPYRIVEAYSDSKEDILDKADKSFLVKDKKLIPYKQ